MPIATTTESPFIFEGTKDNFAELVPRNSASGPVLVKYWSPKAGPCLRLYALLDKLAHEFGGKFLLVNVNTDEQRAIARDYGVTSFPTLKLFRNRQVAVTMHGYQPEDDLRGLLKKHTAGQADTAIAVALHAYNEGEVDKALQLLAETAAAHPQDIRVPLTLAKLLMREQRMSQAHRLLSTLPAEYREQIEIRNLLAHIGFILAARDATPKSELEQKIHADGADLESRYQLAALRLVADDYDGAMEPLLAILRSDHNFRQGATQRFARYLRHAPQRRPASRALSRFDDRW